MLSRMFERRTLPKGWRFEILKRDNFACRYCGARAPTAVLHVDHVHSVALGGKNVLENLVTSCRDCNVGKGARLIEDRSAFARQLDLPMPTRVQTRPRRKRRT